MRQIFIAIGANIGHRQTGSPQQTCIAAIDHLRQSGIGIIRCSRLYFTVPEPPSGQPQFVNGVIAVRTGLAPLPLLDLLLATEKRFDRRRSRANAPRTLDLDLLSYGEIVFENRRLTLPHPRLAERAFVLGPLAEIAGDWHHPVLHQSTEELLRKINDPGKIRIAV